MKKFIILTLTLLLAFACSQSNATDNKSILSSENILIDVRTDKEYQDGHLKNAINIPYNKIGKEINGAVQDKDQTIVVYCRSGRRSAIAEKTLKGLGYNNIIDGGSFKNLKAMEKLH